MTDTFGRPREGVGGGWSPASATAAALAGCLSGAEPDLACAGRDFGGRIHRRPAAVALPRSAADVVAVVELGRAASLAVVPRGRGHAIDGQAQTAGGLVVDLAHMAGVDAPAEDSVTVRGGATWRDVVTAAAASGLAPLVVPDYLDLTVAGTISVGGLGAATHRHGTVADTVLELEVVSPAGRVETCSPRQCSTLFDLVRGGQGRHGIITAARLRLAPAPVDVSRVAVVYGDVTGFLADQERLVTDSALVGLLGHARPVRPGDWRFVLEATVAGPDAGGLLARLGGGRPQPVQRTTYAAHLRRLDPEVARQQRSGAWDMPHPRCTLLVPGRHAADVVASVLAGLGPADLGGGSVLLYAVPTARLAASRLLVQDPITVVFGLQRTAPGDDPEAVHRMWRDNELLRARVHALGGASYARPLDDL